MPAVNKNKKWWCCCWCWWNNNRKEVKTRDGSKTNPPANNGQYQHQDRHLVLTESDSILLSSLKHSTTIGTRSPCRGAVGFAQAGEEEKNISRTRRSLNFNSATTASGDDGAGGDHGFVRGRMSKKREELDDAIFTPEKKQGMPSARIKRRQEEVCCCVTGTACRQKRHISLSKTNRTPLATTARRAADTNLNKNLETFCKLNKKNRPSRCKQRRNGQNFMMQTRDALKKTRRRRRFISLTKTFLQFYRTRYDEEDDYSYESHDDEEAFLSNTITLMRLSGIFATTPLHMACEDGEPPATIASILSLGIPVNIPDEHIGRVPLHYAVESICKGTMESVDEGIEIVKMLCAKDAKMVHQMDKNSDTPIDIVHDTIVTAFRTTGTKQVEQDRNECSSYTHSKEISIFASHSQQKRTPRRPPPPPPPPQKKISRQELQSLYLELKKVSINVYREQKQKYEEKGQSDEKFH
jgi:hypothetical protein